MRWRKKSSTHLEKNDGVGVANGQIRGAGGTRGAVRAKTHCFMFEIAYELCFFFVWNMVGWQLTPYASSQTSHKSKLIPKQKPENKNDGAAHRRKHRIRSPNGGVYMGLPRDGWPSSFNKMKYRRKQQIKEREKVFLIKMSLVAFISSFIHYSITCSVFTILIDGSASCLFYLIIIYSAKIFAFFLLIACFRIRIESDRNEVYVLSSLYFRSLVGSVGLELGAWVFFFFELSPRRFDPSSYPHPKMAGRHSHHYFFGSVKSVIIICALGFLRSASTIFI